MKIPTTLAMTNGNYAQLLLRPAQGRPAFDAVAAG